MAVGHDVSLIASKYGNLGNDMNDILKEISAAGLSLKNSAGDFVADPFDSKKREKVVRHARAVLSAVTRLLVLGTHSTFIVFKFRTLVMP